MISCINLLDSRCCGSALKKSTVTLERSKTTCNGALSSRRKIFLPSFIICLSRSLNPFTKQQFMGPARLGVMGSNIESTGSNRLSRYILTGRANWQIWKTDVLVWARNRKVTGILTGTEMAPMPSTLSEDGVAFDADPEAKRRLAWEEYDVRQSGLLMALNNAMDENNRILTLQCENASEIWTRLCGLYEGHQPSDILTLRKAFKNVRLGSPSEIPRFLNDIKLTTNALAIAGKPIDDDEIALEILEKFPDSMQELYRAISYGPAEMLSMTNLESTLMRYHQREQKPADFAAASTDRKKGGGQD